MLSPRLQIIYEDNHLIAVSKPPGLLVQADITGDQTLSDKVKLYIKDRYNKPGEVFLGVIHRIDRPVSGLVLFARTSKALSRMNEAFRTRSVKKRYLAVVQGRPEKKEDILIHWLQKNEQSNRVTVFPGPSGDALKCELSYRCLTTISGLSLLEVLPVTGRSHQIRAQLASIGHPIEGDIKYGSKIETDGRSIGLHSFKLEFNHPVSRQDLCLTAPPSETMIWQPFRELVS